MITLDKTKPFATITGHSFARFEQNGLLFGPTGELIGTPKTAATSQRAVSEEMIQTDQLASAKEFLMNILSGRSLAKAIVYVEAENNNQSWDAVRNAAIDLGIVKFTVKKAETWRLPETN